MGDGLYEYKGESWMNKILILVSALLLSACGPVPITDSAPIIAHIRLCESVGMTPQVLVDSNTNELKPGNCKRKDK